MSSETESGVVLLPTASGCGVKLVRQDDGSTKRVNFVRYHLRQPWCLPLTRRLLLGMYVDSFNCMMKDDSMIPSSNPKKNCCYVIIFLFLLLHNLHWVRIHP